MIILFGIFIKLTNGSFASCGADININIYNNHLTHVNIL